MIGLAGLGLLLLALSSGLIRSIDLFQWPMVAMAGLILVWIVAAAGPARRLRRGNRLARRRKPGSRIRQANAWFTTAWTAGGTAMFGSILLAHRPEAAGLLLLVAGAGLMVAGMIGFTTVSRLLRSAGGHRDPVAMGSAGLACCMVAGGGSLAAASSNLLLSVTAAGVLASGLLVYFFAWLRVSERLRRASGPPTMMRG
jgi:hypothetical protein